MSLKKDTYIFIDGSYYCFYRYYALLSWWKLSHPDDPPLVDPMLNLEFVDKFKQSFVKHIKIMPKKLGLPKNVKPIIIVGKDCKRNDIWRNELCTKSELFVGDYKGSRPKKEGFMGVQFFTMAYRDNLFGEGGSSAILYHPKLEADDCIAISVKKLLEKSPLSKIYVITNDKDYLQLAEERVELYNLTYKKLTEQKTCTGNAKCDLFCKIVMGDPSDSIKSIFKSCGLKTTLKCFEDNQYFLERLKEENAYEKYELNKKLIDFNEIPLNLVEEFVSLNNNLNF
jgi:5'-3' exonuclease